MKNTFWSVFIVVYFFSKIWDAVSGEELHTFQHKHIVKCVDFSNDGSSLLTGSQEKILRIFDLENYDIGKIARNGILPFKEIVETLM